MEGNMVTGFRDEDVDVLGGGLCYKEVSWFLEWRGEAPGWSDRDQGGETGVLCSGTNKAFVKFITVRCLWSSLSIWGISHTMVFTS